MKTRIIAAVLLACILGAMGISLVPWFQYRIRLGNESATMANRSSLISALGEYYSNNNGTYPSNLDALTPNFLKHIPSATPAPFHSRSNIVSTGKSTSAAITDNGGWAYVVDPGSKKQAEIFVNCTHTDSRGENWTAF